MYKILVFAYKTVNITAPRYLEEPIGPYQPTTSLRYESESPITIPKMQGKQVFRKGWSNPAERPSVNHQEVQNSAFKKKVKSTLFISTYTT